MLSDNCFKYTSTINQFDTYIGTCEFYSYSLMLLDLLTKLIV